MNVSQKEANLIELILIGMKPSKIAKNTGTKTANITQRLNRLIEIKLLQKEDGKYTLAEPYEIVKPQQLRERQLESTLPLHPSFKAKITPEISDKIKEIYGQSNKVNRTKWAKELGIPKYLFNQEVIKLGLDHRSIN